MGLYDPTADPIEGIQPVGWAHNCAAAATHLRMLLKQQRAATSVPETQPTVAVCSSTAARGIQRFWCGECWEGSCAIAERPGHRVGPVYSRPYR